MRMLWISDIHLDRASDEKVSGLYDKLAGIDYDCALLTGDISNAGRVAKDLEWLARACSKRPLYFVPGNHDYYGSSIAAVDESLARLCDRVPNLVMLGGGEIITLAPGVALVGHRGWNCHRSGYDMRIDSPDQQSIEDFKPLDRKRFMEMTQDLGEESAAYFRRILPLALHQYHTVIIGTHFPPFREGATYNTHVCSPSWQPHFVNQAAGKVIGAIAARYKRYKRYKHRRIFVYAGHAHSPVKVCIGNIELNVGGAQTGNPALQSMIHLG